MRRLNDSSRAKDDMSTLENHDLPHKRRIAEQNHITPEYLMEMYQEALVDLLELKNKARKPKTEMTLAQAAKILDLPEILDLKIPEVNLPQFDAEAMFARIHDEIMKCTKECMERYIEEKSSSREVMSEVVHEVA